MRIVYETHATTTDNENGIATGWLPGQLSERGRATAREMGERRRTDAIDVVYVSDLRRALETVEIAFDATNVPVRVDARLRECNYGAQNGMTRDRLDRERSAHVTIPWPEGESYLDVVDRTRALLGELRAEWNHRRVLLIGHSANRLALDHLLLGDDLAELLRADFEWQPGWEYILG